MPVGPIGIFAFGKSPIEHMAPGRTRALLAEAALQDVDLCFFASGDCDLAAGGVAASRWVREGWETSQIALPGLVSIITRPIAPRHRDVNVWLRSRTRVVGFRERNKLEAAALVGASRWATHLIPSERLDPTALEDKLHAWMAGGAIVVKPSDGMRGQGILFVLPDGGEWIVVRGAERWRGTADETVGRVAKAIRGRMRYREYLVQRYIDSRNELDQPVSIRIDIARVPGGGWAPIRIVGRIAAIGKLVSNGASGGAMMAIKPFLAGRRSRPAEEIEAEAVAIAMGVADALDAQQDAATNYECGVDLALDRDDRLWFIEANPLPQAIWAEHERAVLVISYLRSLAAG